MLHRGTGKSTGGYRRQPEPFSVAGKLLDEQCAGSVDILIFVDEQVLILATQLVPDLGMGPQYLDGAVYQVGKVDNPSPRIRSS